MSYELPERASDQLDWKTLPMRMRALPRDERGFPVPWFVEMIDGKPDFRVSSREKFYAALRRNLCWVCGEPMGVTRAFVAGPMCGITRTNAEPPNHVSCGRWSAMNCPFLSNPRAVRREDAVVTNQRTREASPGVCITRNPGVALLWIVREFEVFEDGKGMLLIHMGEPESVEWYANGRRATYAEVKHSIDTGLPILRTAASQEKGGLEHLDENVKMFEPWLPPMEMSQKPTAKTATSAV